MKKNTTMIKEIFLLRSVACLSIVLLHAISIGLSTTSNEPISYSTFFIFDSINMLLYFGTPLFIFISEFLIAYSYRNRKIPNHFLNKRFKFILLPFLFMAFFYSLPYAINSLSDWSAKLILNVFIGDFHGYFILIIFQFYLLHYLFHHHLKKLHPKVVLPITLFINIAYLAFFNYTSPGNILFGGYIWERYYWVPFLGWIFYFTLGYYCGQHYEHFRDLLKKYKKVIIFLPLISSGLLLFLYHFDILLVHSSKRIDIIFHTVALGLFLFYVAHKIRRIPRILVLISQYSFGIYLLHYFYLLFIDSMYQMTSLSLGSYYPIALFITSLYLSGITTYYINKLKYGHYIVGKIGVGYKQEPIPHSIQAEEEDSSYSKRKVLTELSNS